MFDICTDVHWFLALTCGLCRDQYECKQLCALGLAEKFSADDAGQLVMPDPDIVRQLTSVSYTLDGASAALNRVTPELDLSSDQAQTQWFVFSDRDFCC